MSEKHAFKKKKNQKNMPPGRFFKTFPLQTKLWKEHQKLKLDTKS